MSKKPKSWNANWGGENIKTVIMNNIKNPQSFPNIVKASKGFGSINQIF